MECKNNKIISEIESILEAANQNGGSYDIESMMHSLSAGMMLGSVLSESKDSTKSGSIDSDGMIDTAELDKDAEMKKSNEDIEADVIAGYNVGKDQEKIDDKDFEEPNVDTSKIPGSGKQKESIGSLSVSGNKSIRDKVNSGELEIISETSDTVDVLQNFEGLMDKNGLFDNVSDEFRDFTYATMDKIAELVQSNNLNTVMKVNEYRSNRTNITTAQIDFDKNNEVMYPINDGSFAIWYQGELSIIYGKDYVTDEEFEASGGIRSRADTRIQTTGELLYHEMWHSMTELALRTDDNLHRNVRMVQESVMKQLKPSDLIKHIENPTIAEQRLADDIYAYMNGMPSEFLAYAVTNPQVYDAVKDMKISAQLFSKFEPKKGEKLGRFATLLNMMIDVINNMYTMMKISHKGDMSLQRIMNEALTADILMKKRPPRERFEHKFGSYDMYGISDKFKQIDDKMKEFNDKIDKGIISIAKDRAKLGIDAITPMVDSIMNIKGMQWLRRTRFIQDTIDTIITDTTREEEAWFYQEFRKIKGNKDKEQIALAAATKQRFDNLFANHTKEEREAVTSMLGSDWRALGVSVDEYLKMLKDPGSIDAEIAKIESEIGVQEYINQAADLGWMIIHGEALSKTVSRNANQIYYRYHLNEQDKLPLRTKADGSKRYGDLSDADIEANIKAIDKLATLRATQYMDKSTIDGIVAAIERESSAIEMASKFYYEYRDRELQSKILGQFGPLFDKGYLARTSEVEIEFDVVPESKIRSGISFGLMRDNVIREMPEVQKFKGSSEKHYLVYRNGYEVTRTQGVLDDVSVLDRGFTLRDTIDGDMYSDFDKDALVKNRINDTSYKAGEKRDLSKDAMIKRTREVVYKTNLNGTIVDYQIPISLADKIKYGRVSNDIADTLGTTAAHTNHKEVAIQNNFGVITKMLNDSEKNKGKRGYILLRATTVDELKLRKKYEHSDKWAMIPEYIRAHINNVTNSEGIWVKESRINNLIGFKDFSLADLKLFGADQWLNRHPYFKRSIQVMEHFWKGVAGKYKEVVVKLFFDVFTANMTSNMFVAMRHGIGPFEYASSFKRHWNGLTEHQRLSNDLLEMKIRKQSGEKGLEHKIKALEIQIERHPMQKLIADGQFNLILEDLNQNVTQKVSHFEDFIAGSISNVVEKIGEKTKGKTGRFAKNKRSAKDVEGNVDTVLANLYLRRDTAAFQMFEKLTVYNDIINRAIILDRMMQDLDDMTYVNETAKKKKEQEILNYVDQLFVNYSYLDNKYLKYANDVNFMMFTKYFFRSAKAVLATYTKYPLGSLGFEAIDKNVYNFDDPVTQYYHPIDSLLRRTAHDPIDQLLTVVNPHSIEMLSSI